MTHHLGCGDDAGMGQCVSRSGPNNNNKPNILRRSCSWNSDVIENTTDEVGGVSQDDSVNLQAEATGRTSKMSVSPSPGLKELKMEHNDEYEDDFDEYEDEFEEDVDDTSDDEVEDINGSEGSSDCNEESNNNTIVENGNVEDNNNLTNEDIIMDCVPAYRYGHLKDKPRKFVAVIFKAFMLNYSI